MGKIVELRRRAKEITDRLNDPHTNLTPEQREKLIIGLEIIECQLDDSEWSNLKLENEVVIERQSVLDSADPDPSSNE